MVRCPVCESVQIGFLLSPRPTACFYCGATWLQDEGEQTAVRAPQPQRDEVRTHVGEPGLPTVQGGRTEWARSSVSYPKDGSTEGHGSG